MAETKINLDEDIKSGEFRRFRYLLKKGIGERSQTQFSKESGLSRVMINTMLNNETISKPRKSTLVTLSEHMNSVSYYELMQACGYEVDAPEVAAEKAADEMLEVLQKNVGKYYTSCNDYLETAEKCVKSRTITSNSYIELFKTDHCGDMLGEYFTIGKLSWDYDPYRISTYFIIGFATTELNSFIPLSIRYANESDSKYFEKMDEDKNMLNEINSDNGTKIKDLHRRGNSSLAEDKAGLSTEEKLLLKIFGTYDPSSISEEKYPVTYMGCGIEYPKTTSEFKKFIIDNASYFCCSKKNGEIFRKMLEIPDDDIEAINKLFNGEDGRNNDGVVEAIKTVLNNMSGLYFDALYKGEDGQAEDTCIMRMVDNDDEPFEAAAEHATYFVARELDIPTFGQLYRTTYKNKNMRQSYKVADYHFEF